MTWTAEGTRAEESWSTGRGVLLALTAGVQERVILVAPETGAEALLVEAHEPRVQVGAAGRHVAISAIPIAGTSRALWAGALPVL